jgi:hypothetical protein
MDKFLVAAKAGDSRVIEDMINKGYDPSSRENYAIRHAVSNGHYEVVKRLLMDKRVDPTVWSDYPIRCACQKGHLKIVDLLLKDKRTDLVSICKSIVFYAANDKITERLLMDKRIVEHGWFDDRIHRVIREKIKTNTEIVVILKSRSFSWLPDELIPLIMDFVCIKYRKY